VFVTKYAINQFNIRQTLVPYAFCRILSLLYFSCFAQGHISIASIGVKICIIGTSSCKCKKKNSKNCVPCVNFSTFGGNIFRGLQRGGQNVFGQFVFDVASVACVVNNRPLMRGRDIHQWILFMALHGRRLTCDKL